MANKKRESHARAVEKDENTAATPKRKVERKTLSKSGNPSKEIEGIKSIWQTKIDWSCILQGVVLAIAAQLFLSLASTFTGYGIAGISSINGLRSIVNGLGAWMIIIAMVASFIGAYTASKIADARFSVEGLAFGAFVWAIIVLADVLLSTIGVGGLPGFAGNAVLALRSVIPSGGVVSVDDIAIASTAAVVLNRYFFISLLLSLGAALIAGWLGSGRQRSSEAIEIS